MAQLMTVAEVAKDLRVDDTTVRRWIKTGALKAVLLPHAGRRKSYRVSKETIQKIIEAPSTDSAE